MPPFPLTGKVVFMTGAAGGIGRASAIALRNAGARLALVDIDGEQCAEFAAELGPDVLPLTADIVAQDELERAVKQTVSHFGRIDMVFANAGIVNTPSTFSAMPLTRFLRIVNVDLLGTCRTVKACLPEIRKNQGHVLVTASIYSFMNGALTTPYAVSKAGVEMFARSLRGELAGTGATAGVLIPGWVSGGLADTALSTTKVGSRLHRYAFPGPLGRLITPETVADAMVRGVEKRAARTIVPRCWIAMSLLRGFVALISDTIMDRVKALHTQIRKLDN